MAVRRATFRVPGTDASDWARSQFLAMSML
jgi:hypothetical protein